MSIPRVNQPPSEGGTYLIPQLEGEAVTIPGSKGVFRMLASAKQTNGAMAVFGSDGVIADAPGFHFHNEAHDIFLVTKGFMKLYNGDRCLVMGPGDFASVPPKIVHNPHIIGPYTQTFGLITPGEWVDFFRHVGEPYAGLLVPETDNRDLKSIIMPKIMAAPKDAFDVVFMRPGTYTPPEVGEWGPQDETLPESQTPYYLRANTGPRWVLGGVMSRPFITTRQSEGKFAISSIESSAVYGVGPLGRQMVFERTHHVFSVLEGVLAVTLGAGGERNLVREGESVVVPAGESFSLGFESKYVRVWSFASGDGVEAVVHSAGQKFERMVLPDEALAWEESKVEEVCNGFGVKLV